MSRQWLSCGWLKRRRNRKHSRGPKRRKKPCVYREKGVQHAETRSLLQAIVAACASASLRLRRNLTRRMEFLPNLYDLRLLSIWETAFSSDSQSPDLGSDPGQSACHSGPCTHVILGMQRFGAMPAMFVFRRCRSYR